MMNKPRTNRCCAYFAIALTVVVLALTPWLGNRFEEPTRRTPEVLEEMGSSVQRNTELLEEIVEQLRAYLMRWAPLRSEPPTVEDR